MYGEIYKILKRNFRQLAEYHRQSSTNFDNGHKVLLSFPRHFGGKQIFPEHFHFPCFPGQMGTLRLLILAITFVLTNADNR